MKHRTLPFDPMDLRQLKRSCSHCALNKICLPAGINQADLERLDMAVRDKRLLERGDYLYRQGDVFHSLYVVRSGSLKTVVESNEGDVQILGFHLPGELIGVDAMANEYHLCAADALERTSICELPYTQLQKVMTEVPSLQHQLIRAISRELVAEQHHLVMMGRPQAQERLAIFLRSLSERYGRLSRDAETLTLTMSRHDIANYLGLAVETISRLFTRMEAGGILSVNRKTVSILKVDMLVAMCGT
ncbi:cyclic nucleotide-binding domain-containing protein [Xanthomonas albilineans]|uniref:cyclic nucleotide-binding domain-containing protein n=1 Tax=Xanthomonas albilineans TaxID=29447 RepID=UPI0005F32EE9|nr:cyclic nucleotide-binding domain-containing protein [Xanthomonas albilineans]